MAIAFSLLVSVLLLITSKSMFDNGRTFFGWANIVISALNAAVVLDYFFGG
jgi:hypothetical protein